MTKAAQSKREPVAPGGSIPKSAPLISLPSSEPDGSDQGGTGETLIPPSDLDAEGLVLSHCLEHGPIGGLLGMHFYADANRRVYEALSTISARGEPLDVVAVARELRLSDRLQQVGGTSYLCLLAGSVPATAYAESHAAAIRELYRRRLLGDAAVRLRAELFTGACDSQGAWVRFRAICEEENA